jgi:hypothetical protein
MPLVVRRQHPVVQDMGLNRRFDLQYQESVYVHKRAKLS